MGVLPKDKVPLRPAQHGVFVSGVGGDHLAGVHIQDAEPDRDKHLGRVVFTDPLVHLPEHLRRMDAGLGRIVDHDAGHHHEEGGRDSLSRDVRHHEAKVILIDQEEVVEVAAHLLGRIHGGMDVQVVPVRVGREDVRQHGFLNPLRQIQLGADAFLLPGDLGQVFHIMGHAHFHIPQNQGQMLELVVRVQVQVLEVGQVVQRPVALVEDVFLRGGRYPVDRLREMPVGVLLHDPGDDQGDGADQHQIDNHILEKAAGGRCPLPGNVQKLRIEHDHGDQHGNRRDRDSRPEEQPENPVAQRLLDFLRRRFFDGLLLFAF